MASLGVSSRASMVMSRLRMATSSSYVILGMSTPAGEGDGDDDNEDDESTVTTTTTTTTTTIMLPPTYCAFSTCLGWPCRGSAP